MPRFSVLMPAYRTPPELLRKAVASVQAQTLDDWELVVVDDGSPAGEVMPVLQELAATDPRIRPIRLEQNQGISGASAAGLAACTGQWLALVDHDDLLEASALAQVAAHVDEFPDTDVVYSDEGSIDMDDEPIGVFLKPDWSPERLRAQQYVNHLCCYRMALVAEVGGFRPGFDGSQDYDLLLRTTERARRVGHIREVLYHWRQRPGQVSASGDPAVFDAARRAIAEHCARTGRPAEVEQIDAHGFYRAHYALPEHPLVSIVIPSRASHGVVGGHDRVYLREAVRSTVERSTYDNYEFVVVVDRVVDPALVDELRDLCGGRLRPVWYDARFNFAHKMNLGAGAARGRYMVMLNDDVEVITPDWIEVLLGHARQPDVGMVGATLFFEDGTLQHAGHLYTGEAGVGHIGYGAPGHSVGPVSGLTIDRECSGVTAACAMIDLSVFFEVGGMSRLLPINFNDVDLSLKVRATGRRIVVTPFAKLFHYESKTRVATVLSSELHTLQARWRGELRKGDAYWRYLDEQWVGADTAIVAADLVTATTG